MYRDVQKRGTYGVIGIGSGDRDNEWHMVVRLESQEPVWYDIMKDGCSETSQQRT